MKILNEVIFVRIEIYGLIV